MLIGFNHDIDDRQKLPHAGGGDELEGFACGLEPFGERLELGIAPHGVKGRHVERGADVGPSAADVALSAHGAGVAIDRSDADEGGNLLAVQLSQFRQIGHQLIGGVGADARHAVEDLAGVPPGVVGFDQAGDVAVQVLTFLVENAQDFLDALDGTLVGQVLKTRLLDGDHGDELASSSDALVELFGGLGYFLSEAMMIQPRKGGQDRGVDLVGFGDFSERFGKVAGLTRIDDDHGQIGVKQIGGDLAMVAASGLHQHASHVERLEQINEFGDAGRGVVQREGLAGGIDVDVQASLGHVDSNINFRRGQRRAGRGVRVVHGLIPSLSMRADEARGGRGALASVRANSTRPPTIKLSHGIGCAQGSTICRRPLLRGLLATLRSPRSSVAHWTGYGGGCEHRRSLIFKHTRVGVRAFPLDESKTPRNKIHRHDAAISMIYNTAMLQTITWTGNAARLLDQTRLPTETVYVDITDAKQMWDAIKRLVVRGAPAIGVAAAFGAYLGVRNFAGDQNGLLARTRDVCQYLATSRPTAVNLFWALDRIRRVADAATGSATDIKERILDECLAMLEEDNRVCRAIGAHGARLLERRRKGSGRIDLLTHCNAGGLATVQYGTALAPIYVGAEQGMKFHVYADETRPLLQGSRITAYELQQNGIPVTVICDNLAATVMKEGKVSAVIVGTDRVAANGDVANKIGTLGVAIMARYYK